MDYFDLTQLPQEVQDLLNKAAALPSNAALQARLSGIETNLGNQISAERLERISGDETLQSQVDDTANLIDNGSGTGSGTKAYSEARTEEIFASKVDVVATIQQATKVASEESVRAIVSSYNPIVEPTE